MVMLNLLWMFGGLHRDDCTWEQSFWDPASEQWMDRCSSGGWCCIFCIAKFFSFCFKSQNNTTKHRTHSFNPGSLCYSWNLLFSLWSDLPQELTLPCIPKHWHLSFPSSYRTTMWTKFIFLYVHWSTTECPSSGLQPISAGKVCCPLNYTELLEQAIDQAMSSPIPWSNMIVAPQEWQKLHFIEGMDNV